MSRNHLKQPTPELKYTSLKHQTMYQPLGQCLAHVLSSAPSSRDRQGDRQALSRSVSQTEIVRQKSEKQTVWALLLALYICSLVGSTHTLTHTHTHSLTPTHTPPPPSRPSNPANLISTVSLQGEGCCWHTVMCLFVLQRCCCCCSSCDIVSTGQDTPMWLQLCSSAMLWRQQRPNVRVHIFDSCRRAQGRQGNAVGQVELFPQSRQSWF